MKNKRRLRPRVAAMSFDVILIHEQEPIGWLPKGENDELLSKIIPTPIYIAIPSLH
jgi:hypothetical protein